MKWVIFHGPTSQGNSSQTLNGQKDPHFGRMRGSTLNNNTLIGGGGKLPSNRITVDYIYRQVDTLDRLLLQL